MPDLAVIDGGAMQESGRTVNTGLRVSQFKAYLEDCRWQPPWRNQADKAADYADGNQLDQETLDALDRKGMGPLTRNIIQPLVNVVLGMEARTRSDWRVTADDDSWQPVAEALSARLHETEREARADRACSDSYAAEIKTGLGWVEVSRNRDPFAYPYRCQYVHRREIWWDWRDETPDLSKARFLLRKRWYDVDQAVAFFPEHEELLRVTVGDPMRYELLTSKRALDLGMTLEESRGLDIEDIEEWRSFDRQRLCLYEVWYRQFVRGYVAKLPTGQVIEIDPKNRVHLALLNRRVIQPERAVYSKLRMSMWAGPHKLLDVACPKRHFPYVPFWGYREDRTGVPYGLVRAMISPQDEVNARLQKMMWLLGAKRVRMDSDALDQEVQSPADMLLELARPDAVIFQNPHRTNRTGAIEIDDNLTLADAQFKILQDAIQSAQQVVGVFNAMLGKEKAGQSGEAITQLVDQGTMALAEINDNYRYSRRLVGERLLDLVRDDLIGVEVEVQTGEPGRRRKVVLNQRIERPQSATEDVAIGMMRNDVASASVKVALDDVPSSPSYREQQFKSLAELTKGLPPNLQAIVAPFVIEASDLQRRREMSDTMRKALGMPTPKTKEEEEQAEQAQQQALQEVQAIQKRMALAELAEREAKVEEIKAQAAKTRAEAEVALRGNGADTKFQEELQQRVAEIEAQARADVDKLTADLMTVRMGAATRETKLLGDLARVTAELRTQAGNKQVEIRKSEIEREIAEIEKAKEIEVARINAQSQAVVDGITEQVAKVRVDMEKKIEDAKRAGEEAAKKAAAEAEKRVRDEQRVADKSRKEAEHGKEKDSKAAADAVSEVRKEVQGVAKEVKTLAADLKKPKPKAKRRATVKVGDKKYDVEIGE
jgi:hypothetical protein